MAFPGGCNGIREYPLVCFYIRKCNLFVIHLPVSPSCVAVTQDIVKIKKSIKTETRCFFQTSHQRPVRAMPFFPSREIIFLRGEKREALLLPLFWSIFENSWPMYPISVIMAFLCLQMIVNCKTEFMKTSCFIYWHLNAAPSVACYMGLSCQWCFHFV